ncbi:2-oxoglutarate dehydrogenase E1 component [Alkalihalobacterium chitinilyticum]|uniref:2-oxoglutarate dehydrogenase E1 component n=1 Tax=Alkalihalobacterium chitinilyticum TaxID=2980103 RepID=A0ABT5VBC8_9BACI|nr:2-oxoglutarate dehydrogenase E1 component [Alkalihalobacterium chitinilyticum]MDE5412773.1 2-oxoglutarate dehydrogenase E1 component [Alkalihalobacterium chitinilyticum]
MNKKQSKQKKLWQQFHGPNLGYVLEKHEELSKELNEETDTFYEWTSTAEQENEGQKTELSSIPFEKVASAIKMADAIRQNGHMVANIYPFSVMKKEGHKFNLERFQLTEEDLLKIPYQLLCPYAPPQVSTGKEAIEYLKDVYTDTLAFEFSHVHEEYEHEWLMEMVESGAIYRPLTTEDRQALLERLTEVEEFEAFLHRTFVGQKRFSIEGLDTLIPILDSVVEEAVQVGVKNIMVGMAHRGRLNVLAHVLGKPYELIFSEFLHAPNKNLVPSEGSIGINYGWSGDVKYHLGANRKISDRKTEQAKLTLANNPSHLEFVNPVVEGFTRASQDVRTNRGFPSHHSSEAFSILIHGDAAFPGQGIVAETLNLSRLQGYQTGGTIHIIANNLIGFTTDTGDSRSTRYASDLAKGFEIPIIHVNADDPEACLAAIHLAFQYRIRFEKDIIIDLVGYRRYGHNEMDEPMMTQPKMYSKIKEHPTVKTIYENHLLKSGVITNDEMKGMETPIRETLESAYEKMKQVKQQGKREIDVPKKIREGLPTIETKVEAKELKEINDALLTWPEQFKVNKKLERILKRRSQSFEERGKMDWGFAETLAFATILRDGTPIRITGQDSERGTFAQRHLILHDRETGEKYSPLHRLPQAKASFAIHNSPLSEAAVVGFEYGYNVFAPETLVLWEAQYGDFANSAQVLMDQFISAGRAKWGQRSGLVMLLPHGYEGQGPEHSSARLERFLQLSAENNWTIANVSTAAQYFHILRRQAAILQRDEVRPLIIMTPKSMLRHSKTASTIEELSKGSFQSFITMLPKQKGREDQVKRMIFSTGKMSVELLEKIEKLEKEEQEPLQHISLEELYPFPFESLKELLEKYTNVEEVFWVQEEPKNMGAWTYIEPKLRSLFQERKPIQYIGRVSRSSPAEGDPNIHKKDQERIISEAIQFKEKGE